MKACMFCGKRTEGGERLVLCRQCREQIGALGANASYYIWYMRAVRRALFETGEKAAHDLSLPCRHQSFTKRNIRTEIFY
jgi:hypothetical protein